MVHTLQCVAVFCSTLQCFVVCCSDFSLLSRQMVARVKKNLEDNHLILLFLFFLGTF